MIKLAENDDFWKHFFNNPKKAYNPYMYRLKEFPEYIMYDKEVINSYKGKWKDYFKMIILFMWRLVQGVETLLLECVINIRTEIILHLN